ncbi:hypothetical protein C1H46_006133 [Malus baccata]|uniref:Uncharacterized protein n=1 Tax=Malus baccata TaxID=106549 RepID=A0A540NAT9_MALBA|nr:hypothetical protein C1H46_006133 [Malus baccata]
MYKSNQCKKHNSRIKAKQIATSVNQLERFSRPSIPKNDSYIELSLILSSRSLIKLCKPHANAHRVLEELLSAPTNARILLLRQRFAIKGVYAVGKASLHQ